MSALKQKIKSKFLTLSLRTHFPSEQRPGNKYWFVSSACIFPSSLSTICADIDSFCLIIYHIVLWVKVGAFTLHLMIWWRRYSLKCFPSQQKQKKKKKSTARYWPAPRFHRDRRYWRHGRRSSWLGPVHTTWRLETQRGRRTLQEEGEEVRSRARSFSPRGLSSGDPCADPRRAEIHSSRRSHGNHHLKSGAERGQGINR